jgi:hypothetical protein
MLISGLGAYAMIMNVLLGLIQAKQDIHLSSRFL